MIINPRDLIPAATKVGMSIPMIVDIEGKPAVIINQASDCYFALFVSVQIGLYRPYVGAELENARRIMALTQQNVENAIFGNIEPEGLELVCGQTEN